MAQSGPGTRSRLPACSARNDDTTHVKASLPCCQQVRSTLTRICCVRAPSQVPLPTPDFTRNHHAFPAIDPVWSPLTRWRCAGRAWRSCPPDTDPATRGWSGADAARPRERRPPPARRSAPSPGTASVADHLLTSGLACRGHRRKPLVIRPGNRSSVQSIIYGLPRCQLVVACRGPALLVREYSSVPTLASRKAYENIVAKGILTGRSPWR